MATLPIPKQAMIRRTQDAPPHAEQELALAIRAPQSPIQSHWLLEVVKLLLDKLPPAHLLFLSPSTKRSSGRNFKRHGVTPAADGGKRCPDDGYGDDEFDPCWYDFRRGFTVHNYLECEGFGYGDPDTGIPEPTCPVEEFYENEKRLTRLKMEPLRTLLFRNPKMAVYNELENAVLVHSSKNIRAQYEWKYRASLGQLVFRGLHIEDGWTFDATTTAIFMLLASVVSILIVPIEWLIYGDWGVAWNVGTCFIPLLTGLGSYLLQAGASG
ncbi:hypothetical protein IFR05_011975 [Cadophora sp. M221]|nr:hypothetical protein IFR05_011975 [Cadophora sp. M221]